MIFEKLNRFIAFWIQTLRYFFQTLLLATTVQQASSLNHNLHIVANLYLNLFHTAGNNVLTMCVQR